MRCVVSSVSVLILVLQVLPAVAAAPSPGAVPPAPPAPENYVLGPGDQLEIIVSGQPDLTTTAAIRPDGMIALPLVGQVKAAGKTAGQLQTELTLLYKKYLKSPSVSVSVKQFLMNHVYVMGEVAKPGRYDLTDNMTVLDALTLAGGSTDMANLDGTHISRTESGKSRAIPVKVKQLIQGKDATQNVKLQTGDLIYIPRRGLNLMDILRNIGILRNAVGY